jgi:hypothetical protein
MKATSMSQQDAAPPITYTLLDNGVHQIRFNEPTHRAIDMWFAKIEEIARTTPTTTLVRYLVDQSVFSTLPTSYSYQKGQEMMKRMKERPPTRVALLYPPGFMTNITATFIRLLRSRIDTVRMFPVHERDEAVAWVLSDK